METKTHLGINRTGVQMSPFDTAELEAGLSGFFPDRNNGRDDLAIRAEYAQGSESLGSVPVPGTAKGMLKSGVDMVTGSRPQVLVDKLGERLAFERGGVRLYDTLLAKCRVATVALPGEALAMLETNRDEEAQHFGILVKALESLGADPTAQTPCADLVGVETMGMVQAMNDPRTSLVQSLHVMLDAELIDNAGWDLLIALAQASGHNGIADSCLLARDQEALHLTRLRDLVRDLTLQDASLMGTAMAPTTSVVPPLDVP
ncbi:ferritin-like domain-containing protein [Variovorax sp. UMC13]|uniref:ferritin-like domain-containing protein n=1 Tax=Variovorax sp. UMC13 TaxID=1862326 RepID=UPI001C80C7AC|nr:ferritin-like domain-containing protein [Variovorax sp. UMC13]MBB1600799.1 hypothetical protein [Variovorax sp. UMC13]